MTLILSFMTLKKPGEGSRCKNDEVLYYFKEVVILGPVHFISHWTWTIAFYVFLFLGLVGKNRGLVERVPGHVVPSVALSPPWSTHTVPALNMNVQSSFRCPVLRLLQRAPAWAGVLKVMLGDVLYYFVAYVKASKPLGFPLTSENQYRNNKRRAGWLVVHPMRPSKWILASKPVVDSFENFHSFRRKVCEQVGPVPREGRVRWLSLKRPNIILLSLSQAVGREKRRKQVRSKCFT